MSHSLLSPPPGPSAEHFTRVHWSIPGSNNTSVSDVIEYVVPRLGARILTIPERIVPAPIWWTYDRYRQRFSHEQRQQLIMLGEAIAQFAILLTARDIKPAIQDEERDTLLSIITSVLLLKSVIAHIRYESLEDLHLDLGWAATGISNYEYTLNVAFTFFRPFVAHTLSFLEHFVNETLLPQPEMTVKHTGTSDLDSSLWPQSLRRAINATLQADKLSIEDGENPFLWTLIVHPRSDYGRQFASLGRAFFKSMLLYIIQLKFHLETPLFATTAATISDEETCAELIALMRINTEDLPAVFKTRNSLSQMFFIAIGMIASSKEGRWALHTAWEDQIGEITKHFLRFQGVDPALQLHRYEFLSLRKAA